MSPMKKQSAFKLYANTSSEIHGVNHLCRKILKRAEVSPRGFISNMVFFQAIAAVHALFDLIGLPGNLESRFHVTLYILLASLAMSDFLLLILVNSFRMASIAQERWLYGETMCLPNPFFARYFYLNTVFHPVAVSYE